MIELKNPDDTPCPICGEKPAYDDYHGQEFETRMVFCANEKCVDVNVQYGIKAWNERNECAFNYWSKESERAVREALKAYRLIRR